MKRLATTLLLALTLLLLAPTPRVHAQTGGMGPVAQQEAAIWDNLKAGNWDAIKAVMSPDFVYVGTEGIDNLDASMAGMKTCKLASYSFRNAQTRMLSPEIAFVTYTAHSAGDCGGHPYDGDFYCSSTWVRRDGKWLALAHTETMAGQH